MKPLDECRLYAFVDAAYLGSRSVEAVARQLCQGGADLIQLRAKGCSEEQIQTMAEKIAPMLDDAGVALVLNDFPQIAATVGAPIVHLGQEDFFDAGHSHVREVLELVQATPGRPRLLVGLSTHAPAQAERAIAAGADYIAVGPVFATGTKPSARPVSLEYVRWASAHITAPWFAIGGITLQNLDAVLAAGARRVCVVSAILGASDVVQTCQRFKDRLLSAGRDFEGL
jgi:thiamine-phosphate pyrophosphorylase